MSGNGVLFFLFRLLKPNSTVPYAPCAASLRSLFASPCTRLPGGVLSGNGVLFFLSRLLNPIPPHFLRPQVFTTLALLAITQFTMGKFFYLAVQSCSEAWVSVQRIESILLMEVSGTCFAVVQASVRSTGLNWGRTHWLVVEPWGKAEPSRKYSSAYSRAYHLFEKSGGAHCVRAGDD